MLTRHPTIEATRDAFRWAIPPRLNIGQEVCDRVAARRPDALAIIDAPEGGPLRETSFAELRGLSNRMAQVLSAHADPGDRIGVLLPQRVETAAAHIAILKMGAIALPLFTLFGPEALRHRLADSGARVVVTDAEGAARLAALRGDLPDLDCVLCVDGPAEGARDLGPLLAAEAPDFTPRDTAADDPAILIYTSGTTGAPKGALHGHRVLAGHLPGVEMSHDFFPQPGDRIWTPADWAWIGGLLDVLMPALYHGVPVVACRFRKFTPAAAYALIRAQGVRNVFLPPTALKMMRRDPPDAPLPLRSVASGGETLGRELIAWGREVFGTTINEFYGQTECNMIVSSCAALAPADPGIMGFPVPGHRLAVIDRQAGRLCHIGEPGEIAAALPDPVAFLRYWNRPEATAEKILTLDGTDWLMTGDTGAWTAEGRLRFVGRDDDVISSGGYRIGPGEIEDCLLTHPAVAMAGVVGAPDALRGERIVAFVQLAPGHAPSEALAEALKLHVGEQLARHETPREVRFLEALPLTTTGKIIRHDLRARLADAAE